MVGVHSGKFLAERVTANLRAAVSRLGVDHPVVNDRQFRIWRAYAVNAWPTLVLVDARGYIVGQHAGEITADGLAPAIMRVLEAARADGSLAPRAPRLVPEPAPTGPLAYPQKLALTADGARLAIADTGHDRILLGRLRRDGIDVEQIVGTGEPGLADGPVAAARFRAPLGVAFDAGGERLYIADTGNHAVRELDLVRAQVRTLAGTGEQARARRSPGAPARTHEPLNSPWDVLWHAGTLYVAMAGAHQLWRMDPASGQAAAWIGSGAEALHDGDPATAALAQPSGLAADGRRLFFADSESSAIRWASFDDGRTGTIVGTGLFDFGDRDGTGDTVRLQHPLGVAGHGAALLVADTYNDAIKRVHPDDRSARRVVGGASAGERAGEAAAEGAGSAPESAGRGLWEPGGLAAGGGRVLVADSNHHRVVELDPDSGAVAELPLRGI